MWENGREEEYGTHLGHAGLDGEVRPLGLGSAAPGVGVWDEPRAAILFVEVVDRPEHVEAPVVRLVVVRPEQILAVQQLLAAARPAVLTSRRDAEDLQQLECHGAA